MRYPSNAHKGISAVKKFKIDNFNKQHELFKMNEGVTTQDMHTRFTTF